MQSEIWRDRFIALLNECFAPLATQAGFGSKDRYRINPENG
ncbi:hypothetical protein HNR39_000150 [Glaciimonas immobilis]|uniref:Uncharacterized protein n=1 Tax=Glaciimonas immobilis TaxID=728004 RepID=A0A840RNW0_9BURK|nr:hypothetical protein [Glaciimonas immobilis]